MSSADAAALTTAAFAAVLIVGRLAVRASRGRPMSRTEIAVIWGSCLVGAMVVLLTRLGPSLLVPLSMLGMGAGLTYLGERGHLRTGVARWSGWAAVAIGLAIIVIALLRGMFNWMT